MKFRYGMAAIAAAALAALASCESMSAEQCAAANWGALGYSDAVRDGSDRFASRSRDCANQGIAADQRAYLSGFGQGMGEFCQPARGFHYARQGGSFNGYCPAELEGEFRSAFAAGARVYQAETGLAEAHNEIARLEERRRDIDHDLREHERALAAASDEPTRERERDEIARLQRERRNTNDDLRVVQDRLGPLQDAVSAVRYEVGDRWGAW